MRPNPFHPHPFPEKALLPGNIIHSSMTHRIVVSPEKYSDAVLFKMILVKEQYGIQHGDSLYVTSAGGNLFVPSGRSFFAYADKIFTWEGIEAGHALITLRDIGPHELRPWFNIPEMLKAFERTKHGNA